MKLSQVFGLTACVLAVTAGAGYLYAGWNDFSTVFESKQPLEGVRKPLFTQEELSVSSLPAAPAENDATGKIEAETPSAPIQVATAGDAAIPRGAAVDVLREQM